MIISTEARATMSAYRDGRSLDQFLNEMWDRRETENPRAAKAGKGWPFVRANQKPSNVTAMSKVRS